MIIRITYINIQFDLYCFMIFLCCNIVTFQYHYSVLLQLSFSYYILFRQLLYSFVTFYYILMLYIFVHKCHISNFFLDHIYISQWIWPFRTHSWKFRVIIFLLWLFLEITWSMHLHRGNKKQCIEEMSYMKTIKK